MPRQSLPSWTASRGCDVARWNPSRYDGRHFAVALQYERGMEAPTCCVAEALDALALKIREVAAERSIPVKNLPLAPALHTTVEIDEEIPPEHYKAVAEVIGYVMKMRWAVRGGATMIRRCHSRARRSREPGIHTPCMNFCWNAGVMDSGSRSARPE